MKSIKEIYRIGTGPSSSHTMAPRKAAEMFLASHSGAARFEVTLYGSLAATGKGHMTDVAIEEVLQPHAPVSIVWKPKEFLPFHPNGMKFVSFDASGSESGSWTVFSIGGGALAEEKGGSMTESRDIYEMKCMTDILCEESVLWDYLGEVWRVKKDSVERGLDNEGVMPGPLNMGRKE